VKKDPCAAVVVVAHDGTRRHLAADDVPGREAAQELPEDAALVAPLEERPQNLVRH
jgi:hypothetical protein